MHRPNRERGARRPATIHRGRPAAWLLAVAALAGCRSADLPPASIVGPYFGPRSAEPVPQAQLQEAAGQAYAQLLATARDRGALDADAAASARAREVVRRLRSVAEVFRAEARGWDWPVHVIRSDEIDAWSLPGGQIAVSEPLLTRAGLSDDELAALLAHAMAHALRGHGAERATEQADRGRPADAPVQALGIAIEGAAARQAMLAGAQLPSSAAHEIEADRIGVELAARAGYDPHAAVSLRRKLAAMGAGRDEPAWLARHPSSPERLQQLRIYAQRAEPLFERASRR